MKRSNLLLAALAFGLVIPVIALADEATPQATTPPATSAQSAHHSSTKPAKPHVNLNTASKEQLMTLPGIDDAVADKIIASRPFKSKDQLEKKQILTKQQYQKVSPMVTVGSSSKPKEATKK